MLRQTLGALSLVLVVSLAVQAQTSRCADCHIANQETGSVYWSSFARKHLNEWDLSAHGRASVGCDRCHGGDPTTFEKFQAHQNMLPVSSPASPINRVNLPRTCGTCHTGPFVAFQKSRHYELLRAGDDRGPSCSTCHGEVAATLLAPASLASQCSRCHGAGRPQARPDYPSEARTLMAEVRAVRAQLNDAQSIIRRVRDKSLRAKYEEALQQAEVPLVEARNAGHEFVFTNLKERLERAHARANALMDALANGQP
jgi:hypothetical protein